MSLSHSISAILTIPTSIEILYNGNSSPVGGSENQPRHPSESPTLGTHPYQRVNALAWGTTLYCRNADPKSVRRTSGTESSPTVSRIFSGFCGVRKAESQQ